MSKSKNDIAWETLFDKFDIIKEIEEKGKFEITSKDINTVREARLMTKFDHEVNLPEIFQKNNLSILPVTRGSYVISKFEAYCKFESLSKDIIKVDFPEYITSIDYDNISSEAMAINCAYVSGIFNDFIEDSELLPTVNGRMSSNSFNFKIKNKESSLIMEVKVDNSQIEIDAGYEGIETLSLIEAKNSLSDDFIIRQLYYPYRLWRKKTNKIIKPIFLVYSNGIYNLYEYKFMIEDDYNSIKLIKHKNYTIENRDICIQDIVNIFNKTITVKEPEIPFPQADSFSRIVNLCELLYSGDMTKEEITMNYDFNPRQTNYYTDAGRYLGIIEKRTENDKITFSLTKRGLSLFELKYKERQLKYVELILKHKPFKESLKYCLNNGELPPKYDVVKIMEESEIYNVQSPKTYNRRASTVTGWINWVIELTKR